VGGIIGPIVVGAALAMKWSPSVVFYAMSVPMLAAALTVLLLGIRYGRRADRSSQPDGTADQATPPPAQHSSPAVGPTSAV
jgi:hypothetical protein